MKRVNIIFFVLLSTILVSQNFYPKEKSLTLDTFVNTALIGSFQSHSSGGSLNTGLSLKGLLRNYTFNGIIGVKYLNDENYTTSIRGGLGAGLSFDSRFVNITPTLYLLVNNDLNNTGFEIAGSLELSSHLYNRELITLSPIISYSTNDLGLTFGFEIGLRRSEAIFLPVPPIEPSLDIDEVLFSPDRDGINDLLHIRLSGEKENSLKKWKLILFDSRGYSIKSWEGDVYPDVIKWDGVTESNEIIPAASDFLLKLYSWDYLDGLNVSNREFKSDILVVKDGERYRINIPSIIFPANRNDFTLLDHEQLLSNEDIIKSIAQKLSKFPDYQIVVEGHGNIINWENSENLERENRDVLIPLTYKRAELVMRKLIENGIDPERLSARGLGGTDPIVPYSDTQNRWKNRRVELILLK